MTKRWRLSKRANCELDSLASFIARDNLDAALRLYVAAEDACQFLSQFPGGGTTCEFNHPRLAGLRKWILTGFPNHLMYYRIAKNRIDVLSIQHSSRDQARALLADET